MDVSRTLLLVEDNDDIREVFSLILGSYGYNIVECSDGLSALEQAGMIKPEIALIDIGLPDINGFEVAERIHTLSGQRVDFPLPMLVALTGREAAPSRKEDQQSNFDLYFTKPIEMKKVHAEIQSYLMSTAAGEAA